MTLMNLELHRVYTIDEVAVAMGMTDLFKNARFLTRKGVKLAVIHTERTEIVFKVINGSHLEPVEKEWMQ